ncbi:hypothetical protein [Vibrio crassostreae]|uniref:hypothetical protein n=1 Tax=Vibrio crassostreae TaxID=246167 RepID=UPI001B3070A3|nr:hypothetical protein [Vibrio crassostreae]
MSHRAINTATRSTVLGCAIYTEELEVVKPEKWKELVYEHITEENLDAFCLLSLSERRYNLENVDSFKNYCSDMVMNGGGDIYHAPDNSKFTERYGKNMLLYMEYSHSHGAYVAIACVEPKDLHIIVHLKAVRNVGFDAGHHQRTGEVADMMRNLLNDPDA